MGFISESVTILKLIIGEIENCFLIPRKDFKIYGFVFLPFRLKIAVAGRI